MKRIGGTLLFFGVGSFILPLLGMQFRLFNLFGDAQPLVGALAVVLGFILLVAGFVKSTLTSPAPVAQPAAPVVSNVLPRPTPAVAVAPPQVKAQARRCGRCGELLAPSDIFCGECGGPAFTGPPLRRCPNPPCGKTVAPHKNFCGTCGTRVV